jgi:hypothetical protein
VYDNYLQPAIKSPYLLNSEGERYNLQIPKQPSSANLVGQILINTPNIPVLLHPDLEWHNGLERSNSMFTIKRTTRPVVSEFYSL